jgi:ribosomal protein S27AE
LTDKQLTQKQPSETVKPSARSSTPPLFASPEAEFDDTTCPRCGESHDLAKVKGCIKCLKCGFKFDCNGW